MDKHTSIKHARNRKRRGLEDQYFLRVKLDGELELVEGQKIVIQSGMHENCAQCGTPLRTGNLAWLIIPDLEAIYFCDKPTCVEIIEPLKENLKQPTSENIEK